MAVLLEERVVVVGRGAAAIVRRHPSRASARQHRRLRTSPHNVLGDAARLSTIITWMRRTPWRCGRSPGQYDPRLDLDDGGAARGAGWSCQPQSATPPRSRAQLIAAGNGAVAEPAQIWGSPTIDDNVKLWGNFGHLFAGGVQAYGHANYASRRVESGFFFRNPNTRAAVFSADRGQSLLIGDVLDARDGVLDGSAGCPVVPVSAGSPDQAALARVFADRNCFSLQERFPGGFTPQFGGDVLDASLVAGLRGQFAGGVLWDASASAGSSEADFFIYDTVNASLGLDTPTTFDPGLYRQDDIGLNVDLGYPLNDRVHLAAGVEWRDERFTIGLGDEPSWRIGPYAPQGFSAGSNGFPGFSPIAAGAWSRANTALYGDLEVRGRDDGWSLGGALRLEDFEDFGTTTNGKLSRLRLAAGAALRASSASSGDGSPTFNEATRPEQRPPHVAGLRGGEPLLTSARARWSTGAFSLRLLPDRVRADARPRRRSTARRGGDAPATCRTLHQ